MKKIIYSLIVLQLLNSCSKSTETDAKTIADLMCKAQIDQSKTIENLKYVDEMEKIEEKYKGEEKEKLLKLAEDFYIKQCGDKVLADFHKSTTKESSQTDDEFNNWKKESENSYAEVDKLLDDYERFVTEYSNTYNSAYSGDVSAISIVPKLLDRAKILGISLNNASSKGRLNPDQIKKLDLINSRILGFEPNLFD